MLLVIALVVLGIMIIVINSLGRLKIALMPFSSNACSCAVVKAPCTTSTLPDTRTYTGSSAMQVLLKKTNPV